jgi:hypothetical protein
VCAFLGGWGACVRACVIVRARVYESVGVHGADVGLARTIYICYTVFLDGKSSYTGSYMVYL